MTYYSPPPGDVPEEVVTLFINISLDLRRRGFQNYSARAIFHRMRWHMHVERGNSDYKINNNWSAGLSRWAMKEYPDLDGFFHTREQQDVA